jgi:hypothetical protein
MNARGVAKNRDTPTVPRLAPLLCTARDHVFTGRSDATQNPDSKNHKRDFD